MLGHCFNLFNYLNLSSFFILTIVLSTTYIMWNTYLNGRVNIPGPIPWPIVGNLPMLLRTKNPNILFLELKMKYGNIVYFTLGSQPFVLCFGFKLIHDVLVKYGDKTKFRPLWLRSFVKLFKGQTSLVFSNGQEWVAGRKFTAAALKDFGVGTKSIEERIHEETRYLIDFFSKSQNSSIDASKLFPKVASNVVSNIIFGERFDHEDPEFIRLLENVQFIIEQNSPFRPDNFFPILEVFRTTNQLQAAVERFNETKECIRRRIDKQRLTFDPCVIRNFLDLYLAQEGKQDSKISESYLFNTIVDMYFAGTDTTSGALQWCMLYMLKFPDVQLKCRAEILEAIGDSRLPKLSDREDLSYVNATLHEIQRIATTAPMAVPHTTLEDIYIEGKLIPKKSILLCDLMSVHLDPIVWNEPDIFRPERFLDDKGHFLRSENFCPFSLGPRQCVGKHLGEAELFLIFTSLLQRFDLIKANPDQTLSTEGKQTFVTLEPQPYEMKFVIRN
ncbi:cytochrome P450 2B4-like isoform X1 [Mytilus edulis]|uniref:cytochrome P450 2B4-like isoform X1 n=1 Tax=Mytilus edulis TaxID=6550 RepID=UPI0039EE5006